VIEIVCPVRDCQLPLERQPQRWSCTRGHSFDVARSGYCNLLQPNERRSKNPGDSADTAKARRRLFERGVGLRFLDELCALLDELGTEGPVLDSGCGVGFHLARVCERRAQEGVGIDISSPSVDLAAREYRGPIWIVSNVDRRIPLASRSIGTVLSITARIDVDELSRVLRPDGHAVIVEPGEDDLTELREVVMGEGRPLEKLPDIVDSRKFELVRQEVSREEIAADGEMISDLLLTTYRGQRRSQESAASGISRLAITQSRVMYVLRPRHGIA